jgi:biotin transport system substrate-specific component
MSSFTQSIRTRLLEPASGVAPARMAVAVLAFVLMTAASAQIAVRLPWTPVPVTLQPLLIVLSGVLLGSRAGAIAMAAYVAVGALGAPVFSNGAAGFPWLLGPTGGYLLAAPAAAFVAGLGAGGDVHPARLLAGLVLGIATLYLGGVAQLMALTGDGLGAAVALGVTPFLVGDVTKVLVAYFGVLSLRAVRRSAS